MAKGGGYSDTRMFIYHCEMVFRPLEFCAQKMCHVEKVTIVMPAGLKRARFSKTGGIQ